MTALRTLGLVLSMTALAAIGVGGCSSDSGDDEGDDCDSFDIEGGYEERYSCETDGVCTETDVTFYIDIRPDPNDTNPADGTDYTFCETSGLGPLCIEDPPGTFKFSGSGTICGDTFTWTAISPGNFTESGTWTFADDGDTFMKESTYVSIGGPGGGNCVGSGRRGGGAAPPPPIDCVPAE